MDNVYNDTENVKEIISKNLVKYRKANKLTQIELAEKLQYSDKNISKWERGDSMPDPIVLKQIADIYGISVDDLLNDNKSIVEKPQNNSNSNSKCKFFNKKQLLIVLLSVGIVWLVATISFAIMQLFFNFAHFENWKVFVLSLPITMIVTLVFSSIWCTNLLNGIVVSLLIWSVAVAFHVCLFSVLDKSWLIFIIAIPIQVLDILWFSLRKVNKNSKLNTQQETKKESNE